MVRIFAGIFLIIVIGSCATALPGLTDSQDYRHVFSNGFLLVRLRSVDRQVEALNQRRRRSEAKRLQVKQKLENARIAKAFIDHFDLCPVYFFYSKHSGKIRNKELDKIVLDWELLPIDTQKVVGKPFLVAEFASIQPPDDGAGLPALIVLNDQLKQLSQPFPFYVRTNILGETEMEQLAVQKLSENLKAYLEDVKR